MTTQTIKMQCTTEAQLADWIATGLSFPEVQVRPVGDLNNVINRYSANVLGLAMIGKADSPKAAVEWLNKLAERSSIRRSSHIATILNIPEWFVMKLAYLHKQGLSPGEIAQRLQTGSLRIED